MWTKILGFFTSAAFGNITSELQKAYQAKLTAETSEAKLEAEKYISHLQAQQSILLAEQQRWLTAWIRPALAAPVVAYVWKLIVYDTMLGLGVTPDPGSFVNWIVVTVIGAYMLTRPFERR